MIGRIRGILLEKQPPHLLVDVQGVGYEVQVSMTTFFALPELNEAVNLHTHFVVREDNQQLYGFAEASERRLFRELIKVSGVGPKLALAILSGMSAPEFVGCVHNNDSAALVRLPGVGKKTAERLVVEMRDRLGDEWRAEAAVGAVVSAPVAGDSAVAEAEHALVALGYKPQDAARMVRAQLLEGESSPPSAELIRLALKSVVTRP
ncbi:MAG TPA: Holliday junction branch migration protein RuvA [Porticoccaceae bacterium]|nr:Holliday junction branch migration protein RuvA [Porticoccaceae bacterium]